MGLELRPYQVRAVNELRHRIRNELRLLLLCAPTGAGKTVIAAHIVSSALARSTRVVFVAHRRELVNQCFAKLVAAGIPEEQIGVVMATDARMRPDAPIQVCSIDTLRNREKPQANLLIIDECHRSLANSYVQLISHYANAGAVVLGLTATPYRADGRGLGDIYEDLTLVATPQELIDEGFLVAPRVLAPDRPDLAGVKTRKGDYETEALADVMGSKALVGSIVEHWQKHAGGRRTVCFSVNVDHSKKIVDEFLAAGIPAEHLDGTTPTADRDAILSRLETGQTRIVSNCGVLCEGWDMPCVKVAILARPTKSTGLYLQQAGRILRPYNDETALILDHAGNALAHGLPQEERQFCLDSAARPTPASTTKTCPQCYEVVPIRERICPSCGLDFMAGCDDPQDRPAIETVDGELKEIFQADTAALKAAWEALIDEWARRNDRRVARGEKPIKPGWVWYQFSERYNRKPPIGCHVPAEIATEQEKADAYRELQEQGATRGYKPGWSSHRFYQRFGHWPSQRAVAS